MSDLFNVADTELDNSYEPHGVTANPGLVDTLVGEGKKYKTPDDLAFAKMSADAHIKRMADENAALRKAVSEAESLKALLAELKANTNTDTVSNPQTGGENALAIDPKTIAEQVRAQLKEEQAAAEYSRNRDLVKKTLVNALGPNFQNELRARLASAGLDESTADTLASRNPTAFLKLIDVSSDDVRRPPEAPAPQSRVNNTDIKTGPTDRTKSYWDGVKAKMGIKAFNADRSLVVQMHNDALRLGVKFFDK